MEFLVFKKIRQIIIAISIALLWTACTGKKDDAELARQSLIAFFEQLSGGHYAEAARQYGGSYETLAGYNPDIDPNLHPALWQRGCQVNGLQCLPIRTATFIEQAANGEYRFAVEFNTPEGELFVLEACCGAEPDAPPQTRFEYRVAKGGDGSFRVLDLPVYVP
jgi:hypothetical protein